MHGDKVQMPLDYKQTDIDRKPLSADRMVKKILRHVVFFSPDPEIIQRLI
jgi:hypothetical protein